MTRFDTFIAVDWSGGNAADATPKQDAIWVGVNRNGATEKPLFFSNTEQFETWVSTELRSEMAASRKVFLGFVPAPGYPANIAEIVAEKTNVFFTKISPSALKNHVSAAMTGNSRKDPHPVQVLADALAAMDQTGSFEDAFSAGPALPKPPKFEDNCFALPPGVAWMPVDDALAKLNAALTPVTDDDVVDYMQAAGRVLSRNLAARRSNPPTANSAVDGYGFAHDGLGVDGQAIPLAQGRAAAGQPFTGDVPAGQAIRILTGAILPQGVDTVVLEEDCSVTETHIAFAGPIKKGANARKAGEDIGAGDIAFEKGHVIKPQDVALIAALGIDQVPVFERLKVGVLSTGDELVAPGDALHPHQTCDANRPMLLSMLTRWGYGAVDLGHVNDDRAALRDRLNEGAAKCDGILTSGGASAGDEDHVSALLGEAGTLHSWRISLKPGRPLALAHWQDTPIFGLPGNPVAAFVCTLIFGAPALSKLSGAGWKMPRGYQLPAEFTKSKKPGRREYLRARVNDDGRVETFASEGSGRISGLSWSDGLVELPDGAADISPGDMVRYIPYSGFGL